MMARRTAGRLGDGGGPGIQARIFPRPRRALPSKATMLQVGEGHAGHQRVPVQASPGPALEVAQAQFLFELLVSLLADPACLDGGCQCAQIGLRREIGEIVFLFAAIPVFADEPNFLAR